MEVWKIIGLWKKIRKKWDDFWMGDEHDDSKKHLSQSDKRSLLYGYFMVGSLTIVLVLLLFERVLDFLCSRDSLDFHSRFMGVWGRQIIAVDGSKIPLPNRKTLLDKYGSIGRRYIDDQTLRNIGKDLDLKYEQVRQMESKALRELRQSGRSRKYRRYFEEYISAESYHHVGVESFQRTWMSEVEREVLGWIC